MEGARGGEGKGYPREGQLITTPPNFLLLHPTSSVPFLKFCHWVSSVVLVVVVEWGEGGGVGVVVEEVRLVAGVVKKGTSFCLWRSW